MAETKNVEAAVVETLKSAVSEDGKFALIKAIRPNGSPSGEDDINLAMPVRMLPKVLGFFLRLIEESDAKVPSPRPGTARRRAFDAANVELAATGDGRQICTFELVLGGNIAIAVDDEQARKISEGLARRLGDEGPSPTPRNLQ